MTCEHTHKDAPENSVCEDCAKELKTLKDMYKAYQKSYQKSYRKTDKYKAYKKAYYQRKKEEDLK